LRPGLLDTEGPRQRRPVPRRLPVMLLPRPKKRHRQTTRIHRRKGLRPEGSLQERLRSVFTLYLAPTAGGGYILKITNVHNFQNIYNRIFSLRFYRRFGLFNKNGPYKNGIYHPRCLPPCVPVQGHSQNQSFQTSRQPYLGQRGPEPKLNPIESPLPRRHRGPQSDRP